MLDLFTIFTKGGMVLWCFRGTNSMLTQPVNSLIENAIIMQRARPAEDSLTFKFKVDSDLGVVYLLAHQKMLQLSYADKLLEDVQDAFQHRFADVLAEAGEAEQHDYGVFNKDFQLVLQAAEQEQRQKRHTMKQFSQSDKFAKCAQATVTSTPVVGKTAPEQARTTAAGNRPGVSPRLTPGPRGRRKPVPSTASSPLSTVKKSRTKEKRSWQDAKLTLDVKMSLDYSAEPRADGSFLAASLPLDESMDGPSMVGALPDIEDTFAPNGVEDDQDDAESSEDEDAHEPQAKSRTGAAAASGVLGFFRGLVSQTEITPDTLAPVLEKMKEHLVSKNVAQEIAQNLCDSVSEKLEGKAVGTFGSVSATVRSTLEDSLFQILSAGGSHDTLREVMAAKKRGRPYVVTFCGVNGVGKSTNLAKIAFWLLQNGHRVLVAACDTFRAGALEQLRVHVQRLHAMHPHGDEDGAAAIQLFERGYGKDPAGIASDAIAYARDTGVDVVLVDTAGRMQDDEPLMRALAKLIKCNTPDLVLFVGEALVGNEAVDQLSKFNMALVDHGDGRLQVIDGVLLTKFDTVDDKMGAAVSMAYTSRKPIMFVGTGQTYRDLKSLNASSVVKALLR